MDFVMGKSLLAPGFRFNPTDVELLKYYLKRKLMGKRLHIKVIAEVDIYKYDPWDLPDKSCWESGDLKWYFFCLREKKYRNGNRIQRATISGYWKTTGKDRSVLYSGEIVGWIKTLVFHAGRPPRGDRTDWVMHEYRLEDQGLADRGVSLDSYVLCMIFQKEGLGPRNGAQYGAAFKEEDWSDDEVEISFEAVQDANISAPDLGLPCNNFDSPLATNANVEDIGIGNTSGSCISGIFPPSCKIFQPVSSNCVTLEKPPASDGDDILSMFELIEENTFFVNDNEKSKDDLCLEAVPNANMPEPDFVLLNNYNGSIATSTHFSEGLGICPSESCLSYFVAPPCNVLEPETDNYVTTEKPHVSDGDDILSMLDCFTEESALYMCENDKNEVEGCLVAVSNESIPEPYLIPPNIYNNSVTASTHSSEVIGAGQSDVLPPSCKVLQPVSCNYVTMENLRASIGDDILPMLDCFGEESNFLMNQNVKNGELDNHIHFGKR